MNIQKYKYDYIQGNGQLNDMEYQWNSMIKLTNSKMINQKNE